MPLLQNALKWVFASAGYSLQRNVDQANARQLFKNFSNLSQAYEWRLNEASPDSTLGERELRPKLLARLLGTPPSEAYFILQALAKSAAIPGDVCEFGVAQGETSALIAHEIEPTGKILHLFDSFEGLPSPTEKDQLKDDILRLGSMEAYTGTMACPEDMVRARLQAVRFPPGRFFIHKGFVDAVLKSERNLPTAISFAYVDFDFYEPIKQALNFVHDHMPAGGMMVVDDYDWFSTGAKTAVDEFVAERNTAKSQYKCFVPDKTLGCFAILEKL